MTAAGPIALHLSLGAHAAPGHPMAAALRGAGLRLVDVAPGGDAGALAARWRAAPPAERPALWLTSGLDEANPDPAGYAVSAALGIPYLLVDPQVAGGVPERARDAVARASALVTVGAEAERALRPLLGERQRLLPLPPFLDAAPLVSMGRLRPQHRAAIASHLRLDGAGPWLLTDLPMTAGPALAGYRLLGTALSRLRFLDWTLVVAGSGPAAAEVQAALRDLGADRLRLWPEQTPEDRLALFVASDLYLWPSTGGEGADALLRAQALGLPVVACQGPATLDRVRDGVTGRLAAPGNAPAFGNVLSFLLRHAPFRESFGQQARELVLSRHDVHVVAAALRAALPELLEAAPGAAP